MSQQQTNDFSKMSLKQLKDLLKSMKIKGVSRLNKKQMLSLLNQRVTEQKVVTPEPVKEATPEPAKKSKKKRKRKSKKVKVVTPEPVKEATPEPVKEATPEPTKEATPEPVKEATPEPTKEATPEPTKEATPEPTKEAKPVEKMSLTELKNICRENKIKGFSKMKKAVIVALLKPLFFNDEPVEEKTYLHSVFDERDDVVESLDYLNTMNLKTLRLLSKKYKLKKYSKLNRKDIIALVENRTLVTANEKIALKLKKFDLKQLKTICKTIKFRGYSKLNKKSIIEGIMSMNN
jgi:hypothetical protein